MQKIIIFLLCCFFLASCAAGQSQPKSKKKAEIPAESIRINDYFPIANRINSYKGEGNEFATYEEAFFEYKDSYLSSIVENGGTRTFKVYQVTNEGIYLVYEQHEYYEEAPLPIDAIKSQFKPVALLTAPLKVGNKFNNWEITDVHAELNLPIGKLKNVIITEKRDEKSQTWTKNYWAPEYGLVKTEFTSTAEKDPFIVTSELEKIN
ncbi:hypothetical protein KDN24_17260 [Bacillus sp. Bva_UNVM-123]|uniref:hypothetical protein n=1 Tax=Bacillus sp. Bva_UNVM-123 TaxID=2829798 RepID=UPI00391F1746